MIAEDSSRIKITRLNINSMQSDFGPCLINDHLFFVSGRPNSVGVVYSTDNNETEMTDIYFADKKDSTTFNKTKLLSAINTKYNEGSMAFGSKEDVIYFSGNDKYIKKAKVSKVNLLKIYSAKKINNNWTKPEMLSFCKEGFSYCHPALSKDGNTMVFASNLENGFGGMDLYMVTYSNGQWSEPTNLGNKINSSANELFPFISDDNKLFFSSNRTNGIGGLDLYSFNLNEPFESESKILSSPLNSPADDFGIWFDSTSENGYFSTNRIPEYKDDIYYFATIIPDFSKSEKPLVKNTFCYTFFEESTLQANDTNNLTYEWNFGNGQKARSLKVKHCFAKSGEYPIQLNIVEKNSGEIFYSEATYTLIIDEPQQLYINCCDTITVGKEFGINAERSSLKGYDIDKVYWTFSDGKYNRGKSVKHAFKRSGIYTIELDVIAKNRETNKFEKFKIEKKIIVLENT
ncbi:MAG: PKD domain-containing protein [Bacteroidia bacterium]